MAENKLEVEIGLEVKGLQQGVKQANEKAAFMQGSAGVKRRASK